MARDAIARQYDVKKNSVEFDDGDGKNGTVTFYAKKGKSIDLDRIHASIKATRLSGNTGMHVHALEITLEGDVNANGGNGALLMVTSPKQQFVLDEHPTQASPFQRLRDAIDRGEQVVSVTGFVEGWNSHFPPLLNAPPAGESGKHQRLMVTGFQTR